MAPTGPFGPVEFCNAKVHLSRFFIQNCPLRPYPYYNPSHPRTPLYENYLPAIQGSYLKRNGLPVGGKMNGEHSQQTPFFRRVPSVGIIARTCGRLRKNAYSTRKNWRKWRSWQDRRSGVSVGILRQCTLL
jgi:hypothetical protein